MPALAALLQIKIIRVLNYFYLSLWSIDESLLPGAPAAASPP